MIVVIAFIINLFAPIVNIVGLLGLIGSIVYEDFNTLIVGAIAGLIGFVFGIMAYRNDIPPRWSWSKSKNQLFSFAVIAVLKYIWSFAAWPFAIYIVSVAVDMICA
jgi:hypothetical protein